MNLISQEVSQVMSNKKLLNWTGRLVTKVSCIFVNSSWIEMI